eukprot:scaffold948_cov29-Tisochrysis_lutea.AAC.2
MQQACGQCRPLRIASTRRRLMLEGQCFEPLLLGHAIAFHYWISVAVKVKRSRPSHRSSRGRRSKRCYWERLRSIRARCSSMSAPSEQKWMNADSKWTTWT